MENRGRNLSWSFIALDGVEQFAVRQKKHNLLCEYVQNRATQCKAMKIQVDTLVVLRKSLIV